MAVELYRISIPVFQRLLGNLQACLDKAEVDASARKIEPAVFLMLDGDDSGNERNEAPTFGGKLGDGGARERSESGVESAGFDRVHLSFLRPFLL